MRSPLDSVGEGAMFSDCPSAAFVRSSVRSSGRILLSLRYFMNGLETFFYKTDREYSTAPTDDLIIYWRSKGKDTAIRDVEDPSSF